MIPPVSRTGAQWRFMELSKPVEIDWTPGRVEAASVLVLTLNVCLWVSLIKHKASQYAARSCLIRQNNTIDLMTEASRFLCDQSISAPLPRSVCPCLFPPSSSGETIQDHKNVFLECDQAPGGPALQPSSETRTEGGGGEDGGRRASVTSVESETSICSMGQLGNTITNSEWAGGHSVSLIHSVTSLRSIPFGFTALKLTSYICVCVSSF